MKIIAVTAALVVAFASPVFAQEYQERNQMLAAPSAEDAYAQQVPGAEAFAEADGATIVIVRPGRSDNPSWDVYDASRGYLGSDPDPFIRNDLRRTPPGQSDD